MNDDSIAKKVDMMILRASRGNSLPESIEISKSEFRRLIDELGPIYKEQYGGLISAQGVSDKMSLLYSGVAVVMGAEE